MKTLLYKVCLFIIFIVSSLVAPAQNDSLKIDSLKKVLLTEKEDTNKVNTLLELQSWKSFPYIILIEQILKLSQKLNYLCVLIKVNPIPTMSASFANDSLTGNTSSLLTFVKRGLEKPINMPVELGSYVVLCSSPLGLSCSSICHVENLLTQEPV